MIPKGRIRFVGVLLTPSLASAGLCTGLSILILTISSLTYNSHTGFLYDLLFGANSSTDLIESGRNTIDTIIQATFGNPILNKLIFFAFWCLVGLVIYMLLSGLGKTTSIISDTAHRFYYFNSRRRQFEEELGLRLIIGAVAVLLGFLYMTFFFRVLLPFSILCGRIGLSVLSDFSGWLYLIAGFMTLGVSLHFCIVLLRLLLLRPRLSKGWEELVDKELTVEQRNLD